jgi:hypothetical protein
VNEAMNIPLSWTFETMSGLFLALGFLAFLPAGLMFWLRGGPQGRPVPSRAYFLWERSFIMTAVVCTAIGFVLLEGYLQNTASAALVRTGATAYLFAGVLVVVAEALSLSQGFDKHRALIVVYVIVAFLAQAAIGVSLLQAGVLSVWIGWLAIVWNIGWLVALSLVSRRDIYFPVLHHFMPLVIGIALLWKP